MDDRTGILEGGGVMRRSKRRWLTRKLIKAAYWRQWRTPGSAVWRATPGIARPGVVFTLEQKERIQAMVAQMAED